MKLRTNTAKITMTLFITLTLSFLTVGCDNVKPDTTTEDTELGEATEATVAETEMEEAAENTEPTEAVTEEADTEEEVIATGYLSGPAEELTILTSPSFYETELVRVAENDEKVEIIGECYNEYEELDFYEVRLETGEVGYIEKKCVKLAE